MRITMLLAVVGMVGLAGCSKSNPNASTMPLSCDQGATLVYTNRFVPVAGGSGVATGPEAANGAINSGGPTYSGTGGSGGGVSSGAPAAPATAPSTGTMDGPLTAMVTSCQPSMCAPDQVAVEIPPMPTQVNGGPIGAPAGGPSAGPSAGGADSASGTSAAPAPSRPTPSAPPVMLAPPGSLLCVSPPPSCPDGQSPQFNAKGEWECTDCALVVTYGGIYGNYRRCVNEPDILCPQGEVPTWVFEAEAWQCKTTCDNGQYDQHTVSGLLVCVPC
jgi:hypothetical protein